MVDYGGELLQETTAKVVEGSETDFDLVEAVQGS